MNGLGDLQDALDELHREIGKHEVDNPQCTCCLRMKFNDAYRAFEALCSRTEAPEKP